MMKYRDIVIMIVILALAAVLIFWGIHRYDKQKNPSSNEASPAPINPQYQGVPDVNPNTPVNY